MLICGLQRQYALENWIIQNITLQNLLGAVELQEGFVISVQCTGGDVSFSLDSDMHGFLSIYARHIRGSMPGDDRPESAFLFSSEMGWISQGLHQHAQRFGKKQCHYNTTTIRQVWEETARMSEDPDIMVPVLAYLQRTSGPMWNISTIKTSIASGER